MNKKGARRISAAVLIFVAGGFLIFRNINKSDDKAVFLEDKDVTEMQQTEIVTTEPYIPPVFVEMKNEDIHKGNLILVNRDWSFDPDAADSLVNIYANKSDSYYVNSTSMVLNREMVNAINDMLEDFQAETGITDVLANSGYRSFEEQKMLYDSDLEMTGMTESKLVAPPGNSEHHTGLAMDFAINDGYSYPALRNEGEYSWIYENAHKYGMFLRYTESNTSVTGYMAESWHFRYVGQPHASIIKRTGMAYEEYIKFIKDFSFDDPFEYKYDDSTFYRIYYVPADIEIGTTDVPIIYEAISSSEYSYEISGNNSDGFIVTLKVPELSEDYNETILNMFSPAIDMSESVTTAAAEEVKTDEEQSDFIEE